ncbi:hypothetical protein BJY01DRAFT_124711 [Aspergillus pseudoustus]|uniref:Zn(2)-C6 fungal-type domain-containing protein n=1 Tax=Aspergillus pseudoustus TaxID=1810923 RepID=A0ABR4IR68_9EURO
MTFHGRPSQNCFRCRQRRIKCDKARPACSQCKRAGKECSGYRDEKSVVFRNENERIIRRVEAAKGQALVKEQTPSTEPETSSVSGHDFSGTNAQDLVPVLARPMSITARDIDDQGLLFFAYNFSSAPLFDGSFTKQYQKTLFEEVEFDASLRNSIISIGLAAVSNVNRDPALLSQARRRYGVTLKEVRQIIGNLSYPNVSRLLRMILMLAIFEMVDIKPDTVSGGPAQGTAHLAGVHMVMKRFPFPRPRQLNAQGELWFYFSVIAHYFQRGGPVPRELEGWPSQRIASPRDEIWPGFELMDIFAKFVRLCASLPQYQAVNAEEEILRETLDLDTEFRIWRDRLPAEWSVTIREAADIPGTFCGQYHVYQNAWAPRVLNYYYLGRLLVNELILAYIAKLEEISPEWAEQKEQCLSVISQLAADICAGIATQGIDQSCAMLRGFFMTTYPLTVAASATGVPDALRSWVIEKLQTIGDRMGIRQALAAIPHIQVAIAHGVQPGLVPFLSMTQSRAEEISS